MEAVFRLTNQIQELSRIRDQLEDLMQSLTFGDELRSDVQLVSEEVLANIITHGHPEMDGLHAIELQFRFEDQSLTLTFIDDGIAFDPLGRADPDLDEDHDRAIGGLGIYLVKQLTSEQRYQRKGPHNVLTLIRVVETEPTN